MRLRRCDGDVSKARRGQQLLHALQKRDIVKRRRHEHHRRVVVEIFPGVFEAGMVAARHRVAAEIGESVLLRDREQRLADDALCAAAVDDDGLFANVRRQPCQLRNGRLRTDAG